MTKPLRLQLLIFLAVSIFAACNSEHKPKQISTCFIKFDSLFKLVDTTNLDIIRNTDSAAIEVLDKKFSDGQRGLLRFDDNGSLRSYAFLQNDNNDASFMLTYDSSGRHYRSTSSEVIQWNFYQTKDTTIKFTFLLCAFDRNYGDIKVQTGKFTKENIQLFESAFTKTICATLIINRKEINKDGMIYITGMWQDKCSKVESKFIDSTTVPHDQLDNSVQQ